MEDNFKFVSDTGEITNNEGFSIKNRIFFFYHQINKKNEINEVVTSIFIILETIQQISFVFSDPLYDLWGISNEKSGKFLKKIITATRLSQLFRFVKFNVFVIGWAFLIILMFAFILSILVSIQINNMKFTIFRFNVIMGSYSFNVINGFLLIPILETLLLMAKCKNNKVEICEDGIQCYKSMHVLYFSLSILFSFLFVILLFSNELFNFSVIDREKEIVKVSNNSEIILVFLKILLVLCYTFNAKDWMIICIGLIGYLKLIKENFEEITYNSSQLELLLCIRNCSIAWAFLMIFLSSISDSNKFIYFLVFGYPLVILLSVILKNSFDSNKYIGYSPSAKDANEFLQKLFFFIRLTRDKINSQKSNVLNGMSDVLLKGYISLHEENCIDEDCPLKSYLLSNNENVQRMCLLNYINNLFSTGLRYYPTSHRIIIEYVKFNLSLKFNMNNAKILIGQIEESDKTITEDYIFYIIKDIMNTMYVSNSNDREEESEISDNELNMKFKKLKNLIEETTKLFNDFWGNLATSLSMNSPKIFLIGKKLNSLLKEIQILWDKDLKNTKIESNTQSIAQLYAFFLKKILRNKHASEEVLKKIEESHSNYKKYDNQKINLENLDSILENPDIICFARTNSKGECNIIQCSNSFVHFIGYQKFNLIGKKIESIMPSIFYEDNAHAKMLVKRLKYAQNYLARDGILNLDKKQNKIICPKEKNCFIRICLIRHTLYSEDDFGSSFLIKVKFEPRDLKSNYPFYILAKTDFTIDSISSSALNLGLTQDLIKKHIIDLNILIRNDVFNSINFNEKVDEYEDEARPVYWVYPNLIYPKDDNMKNMGEIDIHKLISESKRKKFNLVITKIRYTEDSVLAYLFRFIEIKGERNDKEFIQNQELKMKDDYNIMYDLYNLHYIRTKLVFEKEGTINDELKTINNFESKLNIINSTFINRDTSTDELNKSGRKTKKKNNKKEEVSSEEEEEPLKEITKEGINKMQTRNSNEIQEYIFSLAFYGKNISLEKHRPNKERYPTGMVAEPIIKINLMEFKSRVQKKIKKFKKTFNKRSSFLDANSSENETNNTVQSEDENVNDKGYLQTPEIKKEKAKEEEISIDPNTYLNQYVSSKSIKRIQILSIYIFLSIALFLILEFIITMSYINKIVDSLKFGENSYNIIDGIGYSKYFITEALLLKNPSYPHDNGTVRLEYIHNLMEELSRYQGIISDSYSYLTNTSKIKYIKNLSEYMNNINFNLLTISNGEKHSESLNLASSMGTLSTDIFFVSIIRDNTNQITMTNKNTYDLMVNLLNDYLIYWSKITEIIFTTIYSLDSIPTSFYVIFVISIIMTICNSIVLEKFLKTVTIEKEKPLELFFTIKKKIFETLKSNSDVFLNNLLNKIVGNDDVEQETKSEASLKIMDNDIIIQKLKNKNYYQKVGGSKAEFLSVYFQLILVFIIFEAFLIMKFIILRNSLKVYSRYAKVLNATEFCQLDLITTCDFVKSFFYDNSIKILNETNTEEVIQERIENISNAFGEMILSVYDNLNYLKNNYGNFFYVMLNNDINYLIQGGEENVQKISQYNINGFKTIAFKYFEIFRYIWQSYLINNTDNYLYYSRFSEINNLLRNVIRPWFTEVHNELYSGYFDFHDGQRLFHIYAFIIIIVLLIIYYLFFWRNHERGLKDKLINSLELLNLLPGELKMKMVDKLKEEEESLHT